MNNQTFQTAVELCKGVQLRIDEIWRDKHNYDDYKLEVEVKEDTIYIFPTKANSLHYAMNFFTIASLMSAQIYIGTFRRNDGTIVPRICIF